MDNFDVVCYIDPYMDELIKLPIGSPIPNKDDVISINGKQYIIIKRRMNFNIDDLLGIQGLTIYLDATRYYGD